MDQLQHSRRRWCSRCGHRYL